MKLINLFLILNILFLLISCEITNRVTTTTTVNNNITELVLWCNDTEAKGFESLNDSLLKNSNIRLKIEIKSAPRTDFLNTFQTGSSPDIIVGGHDWVGELAKKGLIADITILEDIKTKFIKKSTDGFYYRNKLYGIPYSIDSLILFYNKNLISTPPKTFEDLINVAKPMTDVSSDKYGFLYGIQEDFFMNFPFVGSQGGYIFKNYDNSYDITDIGIGNAGAIEGFEFIKKLVNDGIVPYSTNYLKVEEAFTQGRVAIIMESSRNIDFYKKNISNLGIADLPTLNNKPLKSLIVSRGVMISSQSTKKSKCVDFIINYYTTYQAQLLLYQNIKKTPAFTLLVNDIGKSNPEYLSVYNSIDNGELIPNLKAMAVVWNYTGIMLYKITNNTMPISEAVKEAVDIIRSEIYKKFDRYN
ncbi:MAG: hypothetical protein A2086_07020 [Spirochaetes bacterium GWD1_27_9]|nr:MAG: hypothetical protein A2Z98_15650 [Spirochaetes bacterium GWB1_27_13]OHD26399.1 MAG: hypothetical protein A2Y34_14875 [Spirochaetes bacterium GWC1_27_15]OHD44448.1 MAG: hypothetical protein A2086_07020 [Spirochaetes bacterium GWD1_27_9]